MSSQTTIPTTPPSPATHVSQAASELTIEASASPIDALLGTTGSNVKRYEQEDAGNWTSPNLNPSDLASLIKTPSSWDAIPTAATFASTENPDYSIKSLQCSLSKDNLLRQDPQVQMPNSSKPSSTTPSCIAAYSETSNLPDTNPSYKKCSSRKNSTFCGDSYLHDPCNSDNGSMSSGNSVEGNKELQIATSHNESIIMELDIDGLVRHLSDNWEAVAGYVSPKCLVLS